MSTEAMSHYEAREYLHQSLIVHDLDTVRTRMGGVSKVTGHSEGEVLRTGHHAMSTALDDARAAALAHADELLASAQQGTASASEAAHDAYEALRFARYVETCA